jgi:hypothetical protein
MEDYETDKDKLIAAVLQNQRILTHASNLEASRIYWDEESQSVKQEIIPLADIYKTETSDEEAK